MSDDVAPVGKQTGSKSLDVMRGFALLGILRSTRPSSPRPGKPRMIR
jgi:hypothetical protein